jgi:hypothetical protein
VSFAAPLWLAAGAAAALAVVALHFLAKQRPRRVVLPTARFVPDSPARAPSRSRRPVDLLLLALRAGAALAVALALARPALRPSRHPVSRVVALDVSRAVSDFPAARDSALARLEAGDILVLFDSAARQIEAGAADTLRALTAHPRRPRGSLSAALVASRRAGARLATRADTVELVLVSPLVEEEWDAATGAIRSLWPGGVRLVRVAAAPPERPTVVVEAPADDPLGAALARQRGAGGQPTRVLRRAPNAGDSAWARSGGGALVVWPSAPHAMWPRAATDTVGAVAAEGVVVVAAFRRAARLGSGGVPVARWVDGEPAAVERILGAGCQRDVAIPVTDEGDLAIRERTQQLAAVLAAPCGGARRVSPLADSLAQSFETGETGTPAARLAVPGGAPPPPSSWLLVAAVALLMLEGWLLSRWPAAAEGA